MHAVLLVGAGGALGAMSRYGAGVVAGRLLPVAFPYATMIVNVLGSLLMGVLIGILARTTPAWQAEARLFLAIGVLGGFTTFSSFSLDAVALLERGELLQSAFYVLLSVVLSILALYLGLLMTRGFPA